MMKRIFMALLLPLVTFVARSETEDVDGVTWTFTITDKGASLGDGIRKSAISAAVGGEITIPSKLGNLPVVCVGEYAFAGCYNLRSIVIPEGVMDIGRSAFSGCTALSSVTLPNSLDNIGLEAFYYCTTLGEVEIPSCVTNIGIGAFQGCESLNTVNIPRGVKSIGGGAFSGCKRLSGHLVIPCDLPAIEDSTFKNCVSLSEVSFSGKVRSIRQHAFANCYSLCRVAFPENLHDIGRMAFSNCGLRDVLFPEGLCEIWDRAFEECSSMTNAILPKSVAEVDSAAFKGCSWLRELVLLGTNTVYSTSADGVFSSLVPMTVYVNGLKGLTTTMFNGCSYKCALKVLDGVTAVDDYAFTGHRWFSSIMFPASLKRIGDYAFSNCSSISKIEFYCPIPDGLSSSEVLNSVKLEEVCYPQRYEENYKSFVTQDKFAGYVLAPEVVISPASGTIIDGAIKLSISSPWPDAIVHYTLDGTEPTADSPIFKKMSLTSKTTVKAVAIADNYPWSVTTVAVYGTGKACVPDAVGDRGSTFVHGSNTISLSCATSDVEIRYTLDGTTPNERSARYVEPFVISDTAIVKAIAINHPQYLDSGVGVYEFTKEWECVPTPSIVSAGGEATFRFSNETITLTCSDANASIYYTTDGTIPTAASARYVEPFMISETTTIRAIAVRDDFANSEIAEQKFVREWVRVSSPVFTPQGNTTFNFSDFHVTLSCETDGAEIYYTLDGSFPTECSKHYSGELSLSKTTTIRAVAIKSDYANSTPVSATFTREWVAVPAPSISSASGSGTFAFSGEVITLESDIDGARLFYTTDGSNPTPQTGTEYKGPFVINDTTTVKAIAVKDDYADSEVMERTFVREWQNVEKPMVKSFYGEEETAELKGSFLVVRMSCPIEGAEIHYTTDGSTPTADSAIYTKPLKVFGTQTIKAMAVKDDWKDSEVASISLTKIWTVGDSLNVPDMTFVQGGSSDWLTDTEVTSDGVSSMRSGLIADNGDTTLTTYVGGSGTIRFKWKASCEKTDAPPYWWDYGAFMVDGKEVAWLDGETEWQAATIAIVGEVGHELTWRYAKDESDKEGDDCIWIDQVLWIPNDDSETTKKGSVAVPLKWLKEHDLIADDDPETVAVKKSGKIDGAGRALTIADEFVAGTNPNAPASQFKVKIEMVDGQPVIGWEPDLNEDGTKELRQYTTLGCEELCGAWKDVELVSDSEKAAFKFFKVTVRMPDEMEVIESSSGSGGGEGEIVVPPVEPPQDGLPNGYSTNDIPCVSCAGSEWYDLGLPPTLTMKTQIKCSFAGVNEHMAIIGALPVSRNDVNDYRLFIAKEPFQWFVDFPGDSRITGGSAKLNTPYEVEFGNFYLKDLQMDETIVSGATVTAKCTADNIRLFRTNYPYQDRYTTGSVYYVRIFDKDANDEYTLVRNLVPCQSDSFGLGLIDLVEMRFYRDDGTSVLIAQ